MALAPFPIYFERARGAWKWDVDGRRYVDFWMAQGALLCGHHFPPVVEAIEKQAARGTHFGGPHPQEVTWAEQVVRLVPSAQRVRFTSSGTEATWLALRIARAYTGRPFILRFDGHYHGWHDAALAHSLPEDSCGLSREVHNGVLLADVFSLEKTAEFLAEGQIAAAILEPGGGGNGALAPDFEWLTRLRELTRQHGTLLIFDEVVSGFRDDPGGVQALSGVLPDLTVLGKILCGGLPGGAVTGRAEVMAVFGSGCAIGPRKVRVPHAGTFNANPFSAAAGVAMLDHVADGEPQRQAKTSAAKLVDEVNERARRHGVCVRLVHRDSSVVHVLVGLTLGAKETTGDIFRLYAASPQRYALLRRTLLGEGVDLHPLRGWLSAVHGSGELDQAITSFDRAFAKLRKRRNFQG